MNLRDKFKVTAQNRKIIGGYLFTLPFTLGFIFLFLYPFIQSVIFSLNELILGRSGYDLEFVGLYNYYHALMIDTEFLTTFIETILNMIIDLPLILAFSLFAAVILNQKFKGRWLARIIFFLPVIYGAGIVMKLELEDYVT
ncbi:MAG TPA: hypothetical protein VKY40_06165 [Halanaerobiales bacterium]|nr:hypothetical protein [Halanaerobiales bacterium]